MDVTGLIGNTPLVQIPLRPSAEGPRLWAKAEFLQPGGSVKDRAAKAIIRRARRLGDLRPGQRVVEMSSGNMAAGLAVICNALGHPLSIFMSRGNSPERIAQLTAFGVDLHLVEQVSGTLAHVTGDDIAAAAQAAAVHAQRTGSYYVDQFNNPGSVEAHAHGTGPEILQALNGRVDAFLSVVGSGGTFVGVASAFAAAGVTPRRIAVEPVGAAVLAASRSQRPGTSYRGRATASSRRTGRTTSSTPTRPSPTNRPCGGAAGWLPTTASTSATPPPRTSPPLRTWPPAATSQLPPIS